MICLGIWQLNRLENRRAFNQHYLSQQAAPRFTISGDQEYDDSWLILQEYRNVQASGIYDYLHQVALRNQYWRSEYGFALITPLILPDGSGILVERGWIPGNYDSQESWETFNFNQAVTVQGVVRLAQVEPDMGGVPDPDLDLSEDHLDFWNNVNIDRIQQQIPYPLLPIYIQQLPIAGNEDLPQPLKPDVVITDGNHIGYAVQWFTYATILLIGYPFWVNYRRGKSN